jgi:hypothetical protein
VRCISLESAYRVWTEIWIAPPFNLDLGPRSQGGLRGHGRDSAANQFAGQLVEGVATGDDDGEEFLDRRDIPLKGKSSRSRVLRSRDLVADLIGLRLWSSRDLVIEERWQGRYERIFRPDKLKFTYNNKREGLEPQNAPDILWHGRYLWWSSRGS